MNNPDLFRKSQRVQFIGAMESLPTGTSGSVLRKLRSKNGDGDRYRVNFDDLGSHVIDGDDLCWISTRQALQRQGH